MATKSLLLSILTDAEPSFSHYYKMNFVIGILLLFSISSARNDILRGEDFLTGYLADLMGALQWDNFLCVKVFQIEIFMNFNFRSWNDISYHWYFYRIYYAYLISKVWKPSKVITWTIWVDAKRIRNLIPFDDSENFKINHDFVFLILLTLYQFVRQIFI